MDSSQSEHSFSYNYTVEPFPVTLSKPVRTRLARDVRGNIDRAIHSKNIDFTEQITTETPVELFANPQLAPNAEYRTFIETAYDRATVEMDREFCDGEYHFTAAKIHLFGSTFPDSYSRTLYILADEQTATGDITVDDPDFYIEVPSEDASRKDVIPLDYATTLKILEGIVAQSNMFAAITSSGSSLEENLLAILEMSADRSVHRESKYKFTDPASLGHAIVAISQNYHYEAGVAAPTEHHHSISVENTLIQDDRGGNSTSTYQFEDKGNNVAAKTGVAYMNVVPYNDEFETVEAAVNYAALEWKSQVTSSKKRGEKSVKFSRYITAGLNRINNTTDGSNPIPIMRSI